MFNIGAEIATIMRAFLESALTNFRYSQYTLWAQGYPLFISSIFTQRLHGIEIVSWGPLNEGDVEIGNEDTGHGCADHEHACCADEP